MSSKHDPRTSPALMKVVQPLNPRWACWMLSRGEDPGTYRPVGVGEDVPMVLDERGEMNIRTVVFSQWLNARWAEWGAQYGAVLLGHTSIRSQVILYGPREIARNIDVHFDAWLREKVGMTEKTKAWAVRMPVLADPDLSVDWKTVDRVAKAKMITPEDVRAVFPDVKIELSIHDEFVLEFPAGTDPEDAIKRVMNYKQDQETLREMKELEKKLTRRNDE